MKYTKIVYIGGNPTAILEDGTTRRVAQYRGDSSRPKPTDAKDGDELYETDTKKAYIFNGNSGNWVEV